MQGIFIISYSNGDKYNGEVNSYGERHGKGFFKYSKYRENNSFEEKYDYYEGQWENNIKKGKGFMKFKNSDIYDGEWSNNLRNGQGELKKYGFVIDILKVDQTGRVNPEDIKKVLRDDTLLISIMSVNNETGIIQPIGEICKIIENHECYFHVDAAQSFGGSIRDKKVGAFGDIAATSFYPAKPLGCYGDGGAIFTNDDFLLMF